MAFLSCLGPIADANTRKKQTTEYHSLAVCFLSTKPLQMPLAQRTVPRSTVTSVDPSQAFEAREQLLRS